MRNGERIGYIVLAINKLIEEYPIGYIVDILGSEEGTLDELIMYALDYFKSRDVNLVTCLSLKGSKLGKSLNRSSFLNSRMKFHLAYNIFNSEITLDGLCPDRTHFCFGDRDSLPIQTSRN